jgi:small subunit ribosomal protein S6
MRHYEIVLMVKPNCESGCNTAVERYKKIITDNGGKIHRFEDWGIRSLAYKVQDFSKAKYVLLNVEAEISDIAEIRRLLSINEIFLRKVILSVDKAITEPSVMLTKKDTRKKTFKQRADSKQSSKPSSEEKKPEETKSEETKDSAE